MERTPTKQLNRSANRTSVHPSQSLTEVKQNLVKPAASVTSKNASLVDNDASLGSLHKPEQRKPVGDSGATDEGRAAGSTVPPCLDDLQEQNSEAFDNRAPGQKSPLLTLRLSNLTSNSKNTKVKETEDTVEVWEENESGLSWGHKTSKDKTFEEKWLQQESSKPTVKSGVSADSAPSSDGSSSLLVFGQSSGVNGRLYQRWIASWETESRQLDSNKTGEKKNVKKRVKKSVKQFEEDMKSLVEEWDEVIEEDLVFSKPENDESQWMRRFKVSKSGVDQATGRKWKSINEERYSCSASVEELISAEESFEEILGNTRRTKIHKTNSDGGEFTSTRVSSVAAAGAAGAASCDDASCDDALADPTKPSEDDSDDSGGVVVEEWLWRDATGKKWGKTVETNPRRGLTCESTWFEQPDGSTRELVEVKKSKGSVRGEKSGKLPNGETYCERWEITDRVLPNDADADADDASRIEEHRHLIDKWSIGSNGHKWGEKSLVTEERESSAVPDAVAGAAADIARVPVVFRSTTVREKWYDNSTEKVVDNWKVEKEFDISNSNNQARENNQADKSCCVDEAAAAAGRQSSIVRLVECGFKTGDRYADGTEWNEHWGRVYEVAEGQPAADSVAAAAAVEGPHCEESSSGLTGLTLRIRHHDKWWKETSGNKWGEKRYVDLKLNEEWNENWYNNGTEEQTDRWEIKTDGTRRGEKVGKAVDGSREWREKWQNASNEDYWIDKHWQEQQQQQGGGGKQVKWGEVEGKEGLKTWRQKWGEDKNVDTDDGKRWVEKFDDDGYGNFSTFKEGEDWISGSSVNWFSDHYGECLGRGEKWAVKQGKNSVGDRWMEKWNETPRAKAAEKQGKNRFGDEWHESWKENMEGETKIKWAEKTGRNMRGEEWLETWNEEGDNKKFAKKRGKNNHEEWTEQWGEEFNPDGSGQKWTSKWAIDRNSGSSHGESWGDAWGCGGCDGHKWGEKWRDGSIEEKW